ncbi:hypothetical protein [Luteibacter mycovicinus]|uniref:hypothetical protein n=1 Tax=Luteibacter mycovicinus TaxID=1500890 RepID=UPI00056BB06E|nr:hypothetical protein [Luteibacter sp. 9143a]
MSNDMRTFRLINGQELSVHRNRSLASNQIYYYFGIRSKRGGEVASYVTDADPLIRLKHGSKYDAAGTVKIQAEGFFVYLPTVQARQLGEFLGVAITEDTL